MLENQGVVLKLQVNYKVEIYLINVHIIDTIVFNYVWFCWQVAFY